MEDIQTIAFNIILHAGESKNYSFQAMQSARNGRFLEAEELLKMASKELNEAKGEKVNLSVIFVHAQDHLSMAIFAKDMAVEYVEGFKLIYKK